MATADNSLMNRRAMLQRSGAGFGALALAALLAEETPAHAIGTDPLAVQAPHFTPRAKRVIFLFMSGGPPHLDTFDPKPPAPLSGNRGVAATPFRFNRHGQSGLPVGEVLPEIATCADDLCVIRSMHHEDSNHPGGCFLMNCGHRIFSRPSMGAWVTYGLGTENRNLPGFIALGAGQPLEGARQYGAGFLPASFQATFIANLSRPISNLQPPVSASRQRSEIDTLQSLNRLHADARADDQRLNARIDSFELAFRMQTAAPAVFDLANESESTKRLYGVGTPATDHFGKECLLARRLVENGVRFVQIFDTLGGNFQPWDLHGNHNAGLRSCAARTDRPIAGLLKDLKQRGLLHDTLVIWGGEFGRTPRTIQSDGTDHHPHGFSMWLAGAGVRGGFAHGATDATGHHAVENRVHVHDLHATILHLLGLDHERLTYRYAGRDFRLTDVAGQVVRSILG
jgi:hypothetical protein